MWPIRSTGDARIATERVLRCYCFSSHDTQLRRCPTTPLHSDLAQSWLVNGTVALWKVRHFGLRRLLVVSQRGHFPEHECSVKAACDQRLPIGAEDERSDDTATTAKADQRLLFVTEFRLQLAAGDMP